MSTLCKLFPMFIAEDDADSKREHAIELLMDLERDYDDFFLEGEDDEPYLVANGTLSDIHVLSDCDENGDVVFRATYTTTNPTRVVSSEYYSLPETALLELSGMMRVKMQEEQARKKSRVFSSVKHARPNMEIVK